MTSRANRSPNRSLWHGLTTRIGTRLGFGFGLLCLLMVLMGANTWWQSRTIQAELHSVLDDRLPVMTHLQQLGREVNALNLAARDSLLAADPAIAAAALNRIETGRARMGEGIQKIQEILKSGGSEGAAMAEELGNESSGILVALLKFSRLQKAGQVEPAKTLLQGVVRPKMEGFIAVIDKAQALQMTQFEASRELAGRSGRIALLITACMLALALGASGLLAWGISLSITRPVAATVRLAQSIAAGDLSRSVEVRRQDELGQLQQAVLDMQHHLSALVGGIRESANQISAASSEIAGGSQHLSRRTEEAASSLQNTAGSMEELSGSVQRSADSATSANEMATTAAQAAERGGAVVSQVVARMDEISSSSRQIVDITGVIDSIAFQTNILALNAAVEAARAGEQGRGFAVVAAEVRALAKRAADAAREIKALIGASVEKVESGSRLVQDAGETMRDIVSGVTRVSGIITDICSTATAQSSDLGKVSAAVNRLDQMTQQNAALVEQSAGAARNLHDHADRLQALVNKFRLERPGR